MQRRRPVGLPRGFRRDRDCANCKAADVKCDLNRPGCGPCTARGVKCEGYQNRIRWASEPRAPVGPVPVRRDDDTTNQSERHTTGTQGVPDASGLTLLDSRPAGAETPDPSDSNWTTHYRDYLAFFSAKFNEARANNEGRNDTAPSPCTLTAVWELVSQRVSKRPTPEADLLSLHTAALNELQQAIQNADILAIFGIVTLSFLDVFEGSFVNCQQHLVGARALLDLHCQEGSERLQQLCEDIPGLKQAVDLLLWYDVMGPLMSRSGGLVFDDWHRDMMSPEFFHIVQCPKDTLAIFAHVVRARAAGIEEPLVLRALQQVLFVEPLALLKNGWRYGSAIASIECSSPRWPGYDEALETLVDKLCSVIESIPPDSGRYRHMACLVVILGDHARSPRHQRATQTYWSNCEKELIYPHARNSCRAHWKRIMD